jgi:hypothetical protein
MAKCSRCGLLAVWDVRKNEFLEATEYFRANGYLENFPQNEHAYQAKCFVQKANLVLEVTTDPEHIFGYGRIELNAIMKDRICSAETPWIQGFHPKEHQEMLDRKSERRWRIAEGLIFAVTGAVAGSLVALISQWVAKPAVPVVNISPPTVNVTTPPINVTVQAPDMPKPKQSVPPATKHDRKSPPPLQE